MADFVDRVVLHVSGGDGGNGCASIHREKFQPLGGPDGGDGGRGGDVRLVVDPGVTTLLQLQRRPHQHATSGKQGQGSSKDGADGEDIELRVPDGTVVSAPDGTQIADLVGAGTTITIAAGGRGGLGNAALAGPRRRAPGFALRGEPGQSLDVVLELKSVADVALVGYPSAGKSSLVSVLSAAKPKIADYPFTTLVPNLGVVTAGETVFTVADVPGLIPGASAGRGLGLEFLRHIERCAVVVHVLDCATLEPGRDPESDLDVIEAELAAYGGLADRPRLVVLNKTDMPEGRDLADLVTPSLEQRGFRVLRVSAVTREGLSALSYALAEVVTAARAARPVEDATRIVLRPRAVDEPDFRLTRERGEDGEERFVVRGEKPTRWVQQTDFSNDEAVGFLADRLARLGVEAELVSAGAKPGDDVVVGDVVFGWEPTTLAGVEVEHGRRGTDARVDPASRVGADVRLARKKARRSGANGPADDADAAFRAALDGEPDGQWP